MADGAGWTCALVTVAEGEPGLESRSTPIASHYNLSDEQMITALGEGTSDLLPFSALYSFLISAAMVEWLHSSSAVMNSSGQFSLLFRQSRSSTMLSKFPYVSRFASMFSYGWIERLSVIITNAQMRIYGVLPCRGQSGTAGAELFLSLSPWTRWSAYSSASILCRVYRWRMSSMTSKLK